jgi:hypothetical protein
MKYSTAQLLRVASLQNTCIFSHHLWYVVVEANKNMSMFGVQEIHVAFYHRYTRLRKSRLAKHRTRAARHCSHTHGVRSRAAALVTRADRSSQTHVRRALQARGSSQRVWPHHSGSRVSHTHTRLTPFQLLGAGSEVWR